MCVFSGFPDSNETGDYPCPQGLGPRLCHPGQRRHQDDEGRRPFRAQ